MNRVYETSPTSRRQMLKTTGLTAGAVLFLGNLVRADDAPKTDGSNQRLPQPQREEAAYPLENNDDRLKTVKSVQQLTVDLLSIYDSYKQAHWNLTGPLYLVLHEYYQEQATYYLEQSDVFAERALHMGYSVDGRFATVVKTTKIAAMPAGYISDQQSLQLLIDRVTTLQKEVYSSLRALEESDPPTSNLMQELAHATDKNLWQLRVHLQKPGSLGDALPFTNEQGGGQK